MPALYKLLLTAVFPSSCLCFKPITVTEQNREIPAWTSYKYLETPHKDSIVREYVLQEQDQRTYLMCPRGFVIAQVAVSLLLGKDQLEGNEHMKHKTAVFRYSVGEAMESDAGDREKTEEEGLVPDDLCPTLRHCLMFQACVFNFGNELCKKDPNPGTRKNIDTNITCVHDDIFESYLHSSNIQERYIELFDEYKRKRDKVLNIMYDSKLDFGVEDFKNTEIKLREAEEDFVFVSACPKDPNTGNYKGDCNPIKMSDDEVSQNIWHLTSRVTRADCKQKINEVYCAFQSSPTGRCVPPHLLRPGVRGWQHQEQCCHKLFKLFK